MVCVPVVPQRLAANLALAIGLIPQQRPQALGAKGAVHGANSLNGTSPLSLFPSLPR